MLEILPQLIVNAFITGSIYALASSGLALIYGILRILNFAHGHLLMVGAYCFYLFSIQLELGLGPASVLTALCVAILAVISLKIFVLPFTGFNFLLAFVTTLCLGTLLEASVSMIFGVNVKSLQVGYSSNSIEFYGIYITPIQIVIILSSISILSILAFIIHSTSLGRLLRSIAQNRHAAESLGIGFQRTNYIVFITATLLAAYTGILIGYETNLQPTMGQAYTIKAFAAMILGGLGNIWGTILGSYILGFIENLSIGLDFGEYSLPAGYKDAFAYLIILLVLLFRPQGLFSKALRET